MFKDQLSPVQQGYATEFRHAGNQWAHGQPFSAEDAHRVLDTMERLLTSISAADTSAWYDKILQLADWPPGLLESALISEARRSRTQTVIAFASASTGYARLLRRTPWASAGIGGYARRHGEPG